MIKRVLNRLQQGVHYLAVTCIVKTGFINFKYIPPFFDLRLRKNSTDLLAYHQIFTFKEYDMDLGFTPKFIIDAGANIGLAAVFFSKKFPEAKIVSIEPEQNNFSILLRNTKSLKNVTSIKKALSNIADITIDVVDKGFGNWGFVTQNQNQNVNDNSKIIDSVVTITIDQILLDYNLNHIDLLKIDIEGGEKQLFECNYENWLPKTKCIIIELHDGITIGSSRSFFNAISRYDFSYFNRGENLFFMNNAI
jgi:FkbM family methyltransferase